MVLKVKNLCVGSNNGDVLVDHVSFNLYKGKLLGLIGESGSGKTMTCRAILGLLRKRGLQVNGQVMFNGRNLFDISPRQMAGIRGKELCFIMQNPMTAFNPLIKIGSHVVETFSSHLKINKSDAFAKGVEMLKKMNLKRPEEFMNSYSFQLSGGMLQRVMIGMALALQPAVIIADEPTTALDAENQFLILSQMEQIREEKKIAILMISHDFGVIAKVADEIAVMRKGKIIEKGPVHKIFHAPRHPFTKELLRARLIQR